MIQEKSIKKVAKTEGFSHLNQNDRDRIEILLKQDFKQKQIADILGVSCSTISREIKRNRRKRDGLRGKDLDVLGEYDAKLAELKTVFRRTNSKWQGMRVEINNESREYVIDKLKNHWSPDEIAGRMKKEGLNFCVSKNSIYRWLYSSHGAKYCKYIYSKRTYVKKQKQDKTKKSLIPYRIGINERPDIVNNKKEVGHFEGDLIVSGKKAHSKESLQVIYERKSRYVKINKIKNQRPKTFNQGIFNMKNSLKIKSLTLDNGIENKYHFKLGISTYFCDPYSSWQKGGVENVNKAIRCFIKKGSNISKYSSEYIAWVEYILNHKPRKSLGYMTPYEVARKEGLFKQNFKILQTKKPRSQGVVKVNILSNNLVQKNCI